MLYNISNSIARSQVFIFSSTYNFYFFVAHKKNRVHKYIYFSVVQYIFKRGYSNLSIDKPVVSKDNFLDVPEKLKKKRKRMIEQVVV